MELLLDENAGVLSVLPSVSIGLLNTVQYIDSIYKFLEKLLARAQKAHDVQMFERLLLVQAELTELRQRGEISPGSKSIEVDSDKTLLLAYTFGSIYPEALALASDHGIRIEVFDDTRDLTTDDLELIAQNYFRVGRGKVPVFVRVLAKPQLLAQGRQAEDPNAYLQLRRMLAKLGYTVNLETFRVEASPNSELPSQPKVRETGSEVTVNVYNWYCSCEQFSAEANKSHIVENDGLLAHIQKAKSPYLYTWLRQCGRNHMTPLPMCAHFLAVVIAVHNMEAVPIEKRQIRHVWEL